MTRIRRTVRWWFPLPVCSVLGGLRGPHALRLVAAVRVRLGRRPVMTRRRWFLVAALVAATQTGWTALRWTP